MTTSTPNQFSITAAAAALRHKELTATDLTRACLDRIDARESKVNAWVTVAHDQALARAGELDVQAAKGDWLGALHGIPIGVKDIFDVSGLPTRAGTDAWPVTHPAEDAATVAQLRAAGAVILGKTVTTAFAVGDPGPTRNPWNLSHTPGGSSSGSAAAVADGMCLAALGTQTAGSIIRPSSFNGLAGFKPRHGHISVDGIIALSWCLDHAGALTRSVADAALLWQVLTNRMPTQSADSIATKPKRLWRIRETVDEYLEPAMQLCLDDFCKQAQQEGVEIIESPMPAGCADLVDHHRVIMASEAAAAHADNFARYQDLYPPRVRGVIEEGQTINATTYLAARQHRRSTLKKLEQAMGNVDAVLAPAATGPAPEGIDYTGDRYANLPSSYWGMPVVCFNRDTTDKGLPLGLQVMGVAGNEPNLFKIAQWCEDLSNKDRTLMEFNDA